MTPHRRQDDPPEAKFPRNKIDLLGNVIQKYLLIAIPPLIMAFTGWAYKMYQNVKEVPKLAEQIAEMHAYQDTSKAVDAISIQQRGQLFDRTDLLTIIACASMSQSDRAKYRITKPCADIPLPGDR